MSLESYAGMCKTLSQELLTILGRDEISELRAFLSNITRSEWLTWRSAHHSEVMAFVSATHSQGGCNEIRDDPVLKGLFVLAAHHHCLEAHAVLDVLTEKNRLEGSYREVAAYAGDCYRRILISLIPTWPFEGPSPF